MDDDLEDGEVRKDFYVDAVTKPPSCDVCYKEFPWAKNTVEDFDVYIKPHIEAEHSWNCSECNELFHTENNLKAHLVVHIDNKRHAEEKIYEVITNDTQKKLHQADIDMNYVYSKLKCNYCNFTTVLGERYLDMHTKSKHLNWTKCSKCPHIFPTKEGLNNHVAKTHTCPHCGLVSAREEYLSNHIKEKHMADNMGQIKCSECDKIFESKEKLAYHINNTIGKCIHCGVLFTHMMTHKLDFKCKNCPFQAFPNKKLFQHMKCIHPYVYKQMLFNNQKVIKIKLNLLFTCHDCPYKASKKEYILNHIKECHSVSKKNLNMLINRTEQRVPDYGKDNLKTKISQKSNIKTSTKNNQGETTTLHFCPICGYRPKTVLNNISQNESLHNIILLHMEKIHKYIGS